PALGRLLLARPVGRQSVPVLPEVGFREIESRGRISPDFFSDPGPRVARPGLRRGVPSPRYWPTGTPVARASTSSLTSNADGMIASIPVESQMPIVRSGGR